MFLLLGKNKYSFLNVEASKKLSQENMSYYHGRPKTKNKRTESLRTNLGQTIGSSCLGGKTPIPVYPLPIYYYIKKTPTNEF